MSSSSSSPAEVKPVETDPNADNAQADADAAGVVRGAVEEPLSETREFPPEAASSGAVINGAEDRAGDESASESDRPPEPEGGDAELVMKAQARPVEQTPTPEVIEERDAETAAAPIEREPGP